MKSFFTTAVVVLIGIWAWNKFASKSAIAKKLMANPNGSVAVDTGTYFGPNIDPLTGQYTQPGATAGATSYASQPVGIQ